MVNLRFIRRQIAGSARQSLIFVLCVALSMVTLVSLGSFSGNVRSSLFKDAQALHAADITVRAHAPFPPALATEVSELVQRREVLAARYYDFYSIVRKASAEGALLCDLKIVEPGYPFYGTIKLSSGRPLAAVLKPGSVVVEPSLLDRLQAKVGDRLRIGEATLVIRDLILSEPDRPVNFFALGPRVMIAAADLDALKLLGFGSRVDYVTLIKVLDPRRLEPIAAQLRQSASGERVHVETYQSADSRVKRFFDNLLFFLNLIGVFTLALAGIGIQSTLTALIKEQERTIAIMKALGARSRFVIGHYFGISMSLGALGTVLGLLGSVALQAYLPELFRGLVPSGVEFRLSGGAIAEGAVLGFFVVLIFTALPLYRLKEVKPRVILGKDESRGGRDRATWVIGAAGLFFFVSLVLWRIREPVTALYFILGLLSLILVVFLLATLLLRLLRKARPSHLQLRQALRGLFRPRSATRAIMVTLAAALSVIFSITLVEQNLDASFIRSFPKDAPNLFFIDIQPVQKDEFQQSVGRKSVYYPVIRGTVNAVNDEKIDPEKEREKRGDNLSREFNLTYREHLLEDERITEGRTLFRKEWGENQVSVLDTVVKMHHLRVGDTITFRIQGVPVQARISSIRTRTASILAPFFYFVFPEPLLKDAPQTFFTALRVPRQEIPLLQNRVAERFPNVSSIDLTEAVTVFARIMERLSIIVRFFTSFSVAAGILIVVGSVFATRYARIREAVYFSILGARRRFILSVFVQEGILLGSISALLALCLSQTAMFIICTRVLDLPYRSFPVLSISLLAGTVVTVVLVGVGASFSIISHKPAKFLREQADE